MGFAIGFAMGFADRELRFAGGAKGDFPPDVQMLLNDHYQPVTA
ncbi:MAG TPA: hypothetical protein VMF12_00795 [Xanthobacteraceae bacterium]|nr:hypothetical protein [Xanthobacteraceae bacterium]